MKWLWVAVFWMQKFTIPGISSVSPLWKFTNLLVQLSIFLINIFVGTYRLSSHARLEAFVIQTKFTILWKCPCKILKGGSQKLKIGKKLTMTPHHPPSPRIGLIYTSIFNWPGCSKSCAFWCLLLWWRSSQCQRGSFSLFNVGSGFHCVVFFLDGRFDARLMMVCRYALERTDD